MRWCRVAFVLAVLAGGCTPSPNRDVPRHYGPRVSVSDFVKNTARYKGKAVTVDVRIDERLAGGKSLRDYVDRNIRVAATGPKGEHLTFVITIPPGLSVPEAGYSDDVRIAFVCTRGSLREGNEARFIEKR
jgi:hypothetical protein